jgi:DNA-binding FadR family transcriptional regulator
MLRFTRWYVHQRLAEGGKIMVKKSSEQETLRESFIRTIQQKILSGDLPIGSRLPTERELAEEMGVSRQVINSGITELERNGFIRIVPRHGTYVADFRREGGISTLSAIMDYRGDSIRKEEIKSILEVRWGLESMTLRNAIENASDEGIKKLEEPLEAMKNAEAPEEIADAAFRFHHTMATIGSNTVLPLIYVSFRNVVVTLWIRFIKSYGKDALYLNSSMTYKYLKERNLEKAISWLNHFMNEAIAGSQQIYTE